MNTLAQRRDCTVCHYHFDNDDALVTCASNVRKFLDQEFRLWRCPQCDTIHCFDVVDLDYYYAHYPLIAAEFNEQTYGLIYGNILKQFQQFGLTPQHALLDYGCGANGLFLEFLRRRGFTNVHGYDPYGDKSRLGNPAVLEQGNFDFILLQDVIEHVEDPRELISKMDHLLAPGGYILIGTPNAGDIDLTPTRITNYRANIHTPFHLHIYTQASLESLAQVPGWQPVQFCDRFYADTRWPMLNDRAYGCYASLSDGSMNSIYEPITWQKGIKAAMSFKFWFYALFGYWFSYKGNMSVMFRKHQ